MENKLLELKKQFRNIEKNIKRHVEQLSVLFDNLKVDRLDIDMGMLVRRRVDEKYEWVIEARVKLL